MSARACVVAHGGAANIVEVKDGCEAACEAARRVLEAGGSALDAAIAAVVVLEDDPRMNAGTGSVIRLDSPPDRLTAQMDASVMDANGFGAVAVVEGLKNPVKLARAVYDSPHMMLAGAADLATRLGLEHADVVTERQIEKHRARKANLENEPAWRRMWNGVPGHFYDAGVTPGTSATSATGATSATSATDTVGAVVRARNGEFAAASSTGGIWCAIRGRVGDTPIPGAGLWVGEHGAVAATGVGEFIWSQMTSKAVHDALGAGALDSVVDDVIARTRRDHPGIELGIIAVNANDHVGAATGQMPWAAWVE